VADDGGMIVGGVYGYVGSLITLMRRGILSYISSLTTSLAIESLINFDYSAINASFNCIEKYLSMMVDLYTYTLFRFVASDKVRVDDLA
jgi:hypothetical protein